MSEDKNFNVFYFVKKTMTSLLSSLKKKAIHYLQSFRLSRVLGIHLEEKALKVVLVTKEKGRIHLSQSFTIPYANPDQMRFAFPAAEHIVTGLQHHEVVFRSLVLPLKTKSKVLDALPFQLETVLPFPVEQTIAYPLLQPIDTHATCVSIIATSKDLINKHLNDCQTYGIRPDTVACVPSALFRLAKSLFPKKKDLLFFHLGTHKISCISMQNGYMTLSQSIRLGLADLILALETTYPNQGKQEWQALLSSSIPLHSPLASFLDSLKSELERLSMYMKEKGTFLEAMPCALIGEYASCSGLKKIWNAVFATEPLSFDDLIFSEDIVHSHGLAIGLALDVFAKDEYSVQFLQGEFFPHHHFIARKKKAFVYISACLALSFIIALTSTFSMRKQTKALSEKMVSFHLSKEAGLSLSEIEEQLLKSERSLQKQKSGFPFLLTVPKVSEVLAWLSTHPAFATPDGLPKEGININTFRYQLIKFPTLEDPTIPYQAIVDIEFTAATPRLAREFHEALLKGDRIVNSKKELKWNTQGTIYSVQFELAKSTSL